MTENKDDKLLQNFFADNKQEIDDNGFTQQVIHHLPDRPQRTGYVWNISITAISIFIFFYLDGPEAVRKTLNDAISNIIQSVTLSIEPQSILIATIVLLLIGIKKIYSEVV